MIICVVTSQHMAWSWTTGRVCVYFPPILAASITHFIALLAATCMCAYYVFRSTYTYDYMCDDYYHYCVCIQTTDDRPQSIFFFKLISSFPFLYEIFFTYIYVNCNLIYTDLELFDNENANRIRRVDCARCTVINCLRAAVAGEIILSK